MNGSAAPGRWRIGTSGWVYAHWRGLFYPAALPQREWFAGGHAVRNALRLKEILGSQGDVND